jgi:hypothetical protein
MLHCRAADVYAFGITLWELFTGGHAFKGGWVPATNRQDAEPLCNICLLLIQPLWCGTCVSRTHPVSPSGGADRSSPAEVDGCDVVCAQVCPELSLATRSPGRPCAPGGHLQHLWGCASCQSGVGTRIQSAGG